jgi:hypothetical protein
MSLTFVEKWKLTLETFQAVGIIIGVAIAVNEVFIKDRERERQLVQTTFEVATSIFDNQAMQDFLGMGFIYNNEWKSSEFKKLSIQEKNKVKSEIFQKSFPILLKIAAIDRCIESLFCDEDLAKAIACAPVLGISREFRDIVKRYPGTSQIVREQPLTRMVERCGPEA